jgi:predicted TIM-barrel fold metal-dependent hydrolase
VSPQKAIDPATDDDYLIVDCDSHFTEPPDLWSSRVPAARADRMPVQRTVEGRTGWYINGELWASIGGNTLRAGREKVLGEHIVQPFAAIDPAAWSVPERLSLMDEAGIAAQIVYPNGIGFASNHIFAIEDANLRLEVLRVFNDFYVDIQAESHGRLVPQALLPIWDMPLTLAEMNRLLAKGIKGFTLSDKPELLGLPELPEPYFAPMWDLFNESGAVVNFHIGAGNRREETEAIRAARYAQTAGAVPATGTAPSPAWRSFGHQRRLAVGATQVSMSNVRIIVNLCMSDLFDRYPRLQVVSAESGIGWIPFILESMEFQLDEMVTDPDEVVLQSQRPSDYFRDHIYVMFWFERFAPQTMLEQIGVERILVETDLPHPTCLYPAPRQHFSRVMSGVSDETRRRILRDNAVELYHLDVT